MNATTKHFRTIVGDGKELGRLLAGLASGERIEVQPGQFLPAQWQAVKSLADWLNAEAATPTEMKHA